MERKGGGAGMMIPQGGMWEEKVNSACELPRGCPGPRKEHSLCLSHGANIYQAETLHSTVRIWGWLSRT